jgi:hypothetical protein
MQHIQSTTAARVMFDTRRCCIDFTGSSRARLRRRSVDLRKPSNCLHPPLSGLANRQYRECRDDHDDAVGDFARRADFLDAHEQAQMRQL